MNLRVVACGMFVKPGTTHRIHNALLQEWARSLAVRGDFQFIIFSVPQGASCQQRSARLLASI